MILNQNSTGGECKLLVPAGDFIKGGALGMLKEAAGLRRRKRETSNGKIFNFCNKYFKD